MLKTRLSNQDAYRFSVILKRGKLCEWLVFQDRGAKPQDRLIFRALEYNVVR